MTFLSDAETVIQALDEYLRESAAQRLPVLQQAPLGQIIEQLDLAGRVQRGGMSGPNLGDFMDRYLPYTNHLHSPGFIGHQVAVPYYSGALGSLVDGLTGNSMAVYETGPGVTAIEYFLVNWMLEKIGWQPQPTDLRLRMAGGSFGGGVLTHGGTLANTTALLAARAQAAPDAWQTGAPGDLALLVSPVAHYSMARAAGILGVGQQAVIALEADERGAILPDGLARAYDQALAMGKRVMAVVANACSTPVGVYDPLDAIGDFCRAHNLWLHIDGAHGATALLSDKYRYRLQGIEKADSVTWDAHKMMRTPALCAALLVRNHAALERAFQQEASYLFHEREPLGIDQSPRTIECTKAGLSLKLFMVLAALGEGGVAETLERQVEVCQAAYEYIRRQPGFRCAVEPESNILCFRFDGSDADQLRVRDAILAQGHFYITSTVFGGVRWLRLVFMNPETRLEHVQELIEEIRQLL